MVTGMTGLTIGYLGFGLLTMLTGIIAFLTRADRARGLARGICAPGDLPAAPRAGRSLCALAGSLRDKS
jgi:hypothetical protein